MGGWDDDESLADRWASGSGRGRRTYALPREWVWREGGVILLRRGNLSTFAVVILVLLGCEVGSQEWDGSGEGDAVTVTDSAGVKVVTFAGQRGVCRDTIDVVIARIGDSSDRTRSLYRVRGAVLLGDTVVVLNSGESRLEFFDRDGRHLGSTGGQGTGPGEFRDAAWVGLSETDSLFVFDAGTDRYSVFDAAGNFRRTFRLERHFRGGIPWTRGFFGADLLVGFSTAYSVGATPGAREDSTLLVRYATNGALTDTVGTFFLNETVVEGDGSQIRVFSQPFGRVGRIVPHESRLYVGDGTWTGYEIRATSGLLAGVVRTDRPREPIRSSDVASYKVRVTEGMSRGARQRFEETLDRIGYPALKPAFEDLIVDAGGRVWLGRRGPVHQEATSEFDVIDGDQGWRCEVHVPGTGRVLDIRNRHLVRVERDELDVEHVVVYYLSSSVWNSAADFTGGGPE